MGEIDFHMEGVTVPDHDPEFLRLWISYVAQECNKEIAELSYIFCSDDYILDINKQYLSHDYFTDIITFNYNTETAIAGDIFISVDTVKSNADQYTNGDLKEELHRVIIHGVLHLCGYNDKTDEEQLEMTSKEDWALKERVRFT